MTLPLFPMAEDPGSNFAHLLRRMSGEPPPGQPHPIGAPGAEAPHRLPGVAHGTTIVALRSAAGIVMAGDRRATEGHSIAHRGIEKVFPADRYSAVAIAGAAGPAVEMVRLFQTQLEHYEKVEGTALSLEGKANQLAQMVRANLPLAMEGLVVVPLFAGYDERRRDGRIFSFDVTGGRYEELDFHATGSGGRDAKNTIKLGFRPGLSEEEAVQLAVRALYEAADEDSATGGPDPIRGIYPVVSVVDENGYRRLSDDEVAERFSSLLEEGRYRPDRSADATSASEHGSQPS
ncbi:MAG TPA: proteasome subunit beta [Acidimicrobiales bacterium]|nr:proteasome subunit beta [Acidimicrobiales bacterium]